MTRCEELAIELANLKLNFDNLTIKGSVND